MMMMTMMIMMVMVLVMVMVMMMMMTMVMVMVMVMMMRMMCKRLAQVPMLCVPIYNMKLALMQKTLIFTTFSAQTKMAADKRGQIEVFARNVSKANPRFYHKWVVYSIQMWSVYCFTNITLNWMRGKGWITDPCPGIRWSFLLTASLLQAAQRRTPGLWTLIREQREHCVSGKYPLVSCSNSDWFRYITGSLKMYGYMPED